MRASRCVTEEQRKQVAEAVEQAESTTDVEILPVIATDSGRYDRAEDIAGVWLAVILMAATWFVFPRRVLEQGSWDTSWNAFELPALIAAVVLGFLVGAAVASRVGWLRRLFTPAAEMRDEVYRRACEVFFVKHVNRDSGGLGILLYVSLFERRAAVIAGDAVIAKMGQPAIDALCRRLIEGLRAGPPSDALCMTIAQAGEVLSAAFPAGASNPDRIPNALVVVD